MNIIRTIVALGFHLLPLVPIFYNLRSLAVALCLLIVTPYIKVRKLESQASDLSQPEHAETKRDLERTIKRWAFLTFLKR